MFIYMLLNYFKNLVAEQVMKKIQVPLVEVLDSTSLSILTSLSTSSIPTETDEREQKADITKLPWLHSMYITHIADFI